MSKRRQREREDKLQEEIDKLKRQRKNDQLASFDPTRLYQRWAKLILLYTDSKFSTMAQRIRATTDRDKSTNNGRSFILHRGGRAQVSWRAGL